MFALLLFFSLLSTQFISLTITFFLIRSCLLIYSWDLDGTLNDSINNNNFDKDGENYYKFSDFNNCLLGRNCLFKYAESITTGYFKSNNPINFASKNHNFLYYSIAGKCAQAE